MKAPWYMKDVQTDEGMKVEFHWLWVKYQKVKWWIIFKIKGKL